MRSRTITATVAAALAAGALIALPATPASADSTVTVGPEALLTGSTGIVVTKERETVSGSPGYRSPATGHFVEDSGADGGSGLQMWTGAPASAPYAKYYVGKSYPSGTTATALSAFTYRTRNFSAADPAPYLNVEFYNAAAPVGERYLNLVWTPGAATGSWQDWDTSSGWKTTRAFITGLPANTDVSLAAAAAAIAADDNPLYLVRANVVWGDTGGGYSNRYALLDSLALTSASDTTTYAFDAPYSAPCTDPTGAAVTGTALADTSKWTVRNEYQPTIASTAFARIAGVDASLGQSSALQMSTGPGNFVGSRGFAGKVFVDRNLDGCTLADVTALSYRTYAVGSTLAPYLNIEVNTPASPTTQGGAAILVWAPTGTVADTWQVQNPLTAGTWTVREGTVNGRSNGYVFATWSDVLTELGSARIERGAQLVYGDSTYQSVPGTGYSNKTAYVDYLTVGTGANTPTVSTFANPATTEIVRPTDIPGTWTVETQATGTGGQVEGPGTPPAGSASFEMRTGPGTGTGPGSGGRVRLKNILFAGKALTDVTSLGYSFYRSSASDPTTAPVRPALNIRVTFLDAGVPTQTSLIYEPVYDSSVTLADDTWQSADAFSPTARWWATSTLPGVCGVAPAPLSCPDTFVPWAQVRDALAALGGATIGARGVTVVAGQGTVGPPWDNYIGAVDKIRVGGVATDVTYDFEYAFGPCAVSEDTGTKTVTLLADCTTDHTLYLRDGWTLDGAGFTITATETPTTAFRGAVITNLGTSASVRNVHVTTNGWDVPTKNSGGDLAGIRLKDAAGSITNTTVDAISHGNGVQEGNAVDISNPGGATARAVTLDKLTVTNYQKTGIRISGNVDVTLTDSSISRAGSPSGVPLDAKTAANSLQVSSGARATVRGNTISGNDWDGDTVYSATAVLLYDAGNTTVERNVINGAGTDIGVDVERTAANQYYDHVLLRCNVISRTADTNGGIDIWNTGIYFDNAPNSSVVDNTVTGFATPVDGATNVVGQGSCDPASPTVSVSGVTTTSANVSWMPGTGLAYAPVTGWDLTAPDGIHHLPAGTTSYALSGLDAGLAYVVTVRARNASGLSTAANATFTTSAAPSGPAALTGLAASNVTKTGFDLAWNTAAGATGYDVTVDGVTTSQAGISKSVSGLSPGTSHLVTVTPTNAAGSGTAQSILVTTLPDPVPGPVTGLAASAISTTGFGLSWNSAPGATSYDVSINGATPTSVAGTTTSVTGLTAASAYLVTVTPKNAAGSGTSQSIVVTTLAPPPPPGAPSALTGLAASNVTKTGFDLAWTTAAGATGYDVTVDGVTTSQAGTTKSVSSLNPGTPYLVTVTPKNATGPGTPQSILVTTLVDPVPGTVTGLAASAISTTGFTATWAAASAATSYDVSLNGGAAVNVVAITTNFTGLTPGTPYLVTVTAKNAAGVGISAALLVTTTALPVPPSAPGATDDLAVTARTLGGFSLGWSAVTGATSYDVRVGTTTTNVTSLTYSATGLTSSTTYLAQVRARNVSGAGAWTSLLVITPTPQSTMARPAKIVYGSVLTLTGRVALSGVPAAGVPVTVQRLAGRTWTRVGSTTTGVSGAWSYRVRPSVTTVYRALATGYPTPKATVVVAPKSTLKVKLRTVTVTVSPRLASVKVSLQQLRGKTWVTVQNKRLSSRSAATFTGLAKASYRVVIAKSKSYPLTVTSTVRTR